MINQYLDFSTPEGTCLFLGVPEERIAEFGNEIDEVVKFITENHSDYTFFENENDKIGCLHAGKAIERLLTLAKTPNEQVAIFFAAHSFLNNCQESISYKLTLNNLLNNDTNKHRSK